MKKFRITNVRNKQIIWLVVFIFTFILSIPLFSGYEGESLSFEIQGTTGYASNTEQSANYNVTSYLGDFPVNNGSTGTYNILLGSIMNIEPVLLNASDNEPTFWIIGGHTQTVTSQSFDYKNSTMKFHVCNETGYIPDVGCLASTLCTDYVSIANSSCSFDVANVTGNHNWYAYLSDRENVPAIKNPMTGNFSVDATNPIAGISDANTVWLSSDLLNFSCTDTHSGCNNTIFYYLNASSICSDSISDYVNSTTSGNLSINYTTSEYLCIWVNDIVGNYNVTSAKMYIDTSTGLDIGTIRGFNNTLYTNEFQNGIWQNLGDEPFFNWTDLSNMTSGYYFYTFNGSNPTMQDQNVSSNNIINPYTKIF